MHISPEALPSFASLNTAHWPSDQQIQFARAVEGILCADWFAAVQATQLDKERLATACAFAAFSYIRRRLSLAPDDELMLDSQGRALPFAPQNCNVA